MNLLIVPPFDPQVNPTLVNEVGLISRCLAIELSTRPYGPGVCIFQMEVRTPGDESTDFGLLLGNSSNRNRYNEGWKAVFWDIKLDDADVVSPDREQFAEALRRAIMETHPAVKELSIKDFDVDAFYRDIGALLAERGWTTDPEKYQVPRRPSPAAAQAQGSPSAGGTQARGRPPAGGTRRTARAIPKRAALPEGEFWDLVHDSIEVAGVSVEKQLAHLERSLAAGTEDEIVGFELTLRELIAKANHHNVVALQKVIDGSVTDDGFLYFRCRLILYGRDIFYAAVKDPNSLTERLDNHEAAEHLLSVADRVFVRRSGGNRDRDLPRDIAAAFIDYDTDASPLLGTPWTERTFAKRYAALLKLYS